VEEVLVVQLLLTEVLVVEVLLEELLPLVVETLHQYHHPKEMLVDQVVVIQTQIDFWVAAAAALVEVDLLEV